MTLLCPEIRQMLDLLNSPPGAQRQRVISAVGDWQKLIDSAQRCRLVLPLQAALEDGGLPGEFSDRLTQLATSRALAAARQTNQLCDLLEVLAAQGIPALAYKGPTLSYLAFGHVGARESGDLDILVRPQDYARAARLLLDSGFGFDYPPPTRCQLRQAYEVTFIDPKRGLAVDLHRSFFAGSTVFGLALESATPYTVCLMGRDVVTLAPLELLLLLCVHGSKHCWKGLHWVHDLHGLIGRHPMDWEQLYRRAKAQGAVRAVSIGLNLAHDLFGTPLPALFSACPQSRRLIETSKSYLGRSTPLSLREQHLYHWRMSDTPGQRIRYILWTLFFPHELDLGFVDLPEPLFPLYFLVRPYRLLCRALPGRRGVGDSQSNGHE